MSETLPDERPERDWLFVATPRAISWPPQMSGDGVRVSLIKRLVCEQYGITVRALESSRRGYAFARPRQIACLLIKENTKLTLPAIGRTLGNRDHTTVLYGIRKVDALMATDAAFAAQVTALREAVKAHLRTPSSVHEYPA